MKLNFLPVVLLALTLLSATQCKDSEKGKPIEEKETKMTVANTVFLSNFHAFHLEETVALEAKALAQIEKQLLDTPNANDLLGKQLKLKSSIKALGTQKLELAKVGETFRGFPGIPRPPIPQPCRSDRSACMPIPFNHIIIPRSYKALEIVFKDRATGKPLENIGLDEFTPLPEDDNFSVAKVDAFKGEFTMDVHALFENGKTMDYTLNGAISN